MAQPPWVGAVTVMDVIIMAGHWSQTAPTPLVSEGDFNSDDVVDWKDFAVLQSAIGE